MRFLRTQPILRQVLGAFGVIAFMMGAAAFYAGLRVRAERADDVEREAAVIAATAATLVNGSMDTVEARKNADRVLSTLPLPAGSVARVAQQKDSRPASDWGFVLDADGVERFHGYAPIGRGPAVVDVGIPRSEVLRQLEPMWRRNLILVALVTISVLCLVTWVAWHTAIDLRRLQQAAGRIASGDLSPVEQWSVPNREMAELQASFATMAEKLRHAREALDKQFAQERRMLEAVQSLQRQVVRQERLAAVGLLVSGIAHELNNPLQAILGTIEVVERQPDVPAEIIDDIAQVKAQSNRARDIIRNLSRFSRQQAGSPELVDLRDVIASVVDLRKRELDSAGIALDVETLSGCRTLAAFAEIEQVLLNFVVNAQQSIAGTGRKGGRILLKLSDDGRKVRLEVWDDGPGVPAEDEQKLFQPFFTTKPVGAGTGLGLSVSYGIVDAHGGATGYFRNDWGGATFFIELPIAGEAKVRDAHDRAAVLRGRVSSRV